MLSKNFSAPIFPVSTKNIKKASIQLNPSNFQNNLALIARSTSHKAKTIRLASSDLYTGINNRNKKLKNTRIYLTLDIKDEIEKIINEEDRKRYFNQEFHLNKIISREELQKRIVKKIPFNEISHKKLKSRFSFTKKERPKTTMKSNKNIGFNISRNLISVNKMLLENFRSNGENEIERSKKNLDKVNEFLKKMDEENLRKYNEMEEVFAQNSKLNKKESSLFDDKPNKNNGKKNKNIKIENLKLKQSEFIKFRKNQMIKENQYLKQKSQIFDNILKYDFKDFYPEEMKHQAVNYRLLGRTILMRNLLKQMKVAVYKDETLNVLRGFQSLKIADLSNGKYDLDSKDIYSNQSDNMFFFGNNMRHKPIPHFLKVKFNKKTTRKFGEINGSYFGLPV